MATDKTKTKTASREALTSLPPSVWFRSSQASSAALDDSNVTKTNGRRSLVSLSSGVWTSSTCDSFTRLTPNWMYRYPIQQEDGGKWNWRNGRRTWTVNLMKEKTQVCMTWKWWWPIFLGPIKGKAESKKHTCTNFSKIPFHKVKNTAKFVAINFLLSNTS